MSRDETVNVRYMVDDVDESISFYTESLGFAVLSNASPAFADVKRGNLRLLLSGPASSAGRPIVVGKSAGSVSSSQRRNRSRLLFRANARQCSHRASSK